MTSLTDAELKLVNLWRLSGDGGAETCVATFQVNYRLRENNLPDLTEPLHHFLELRFEELFSPYLWVGYEGGFAEKYQLSVKGRKTEHSSVYSDLASLMWMSSPSARLKWFRHQLITCCFSFTLSWEALSPSRFCGSLHVWRMKSRAHRKLRFVHNHAIQAGRRAKCPNNLFPRQFQLTLVGLLWGWAEVAVRCLDTRPPAVTSLLQAGNQSPWVCPSHTPFIPMLLSESMQRSSPPTLLSLHRWEHSLKTQFFRGLEQKTRICCKIKRSECILRIRLCLHS